MKPLHVFICWFLAIRPLFRFFSLTAPLSRGPRTDSAPTASLRHSVSGLLLALGLGLLLLWPSVVIFSLLALTVERWLFLGQPLTNLTGPALPHASAKWSPMR